MKLKVEILTPIHIGSGQDISPSEYFFDKNSARFHRLNLSSLFSDSEFQPYLRSFIENASRRRYIGDIVKDPALLKKHSLYSLPVDGDAGKHLSTNQTIVKEYVKSAGRVYIPGSSLKGAILSALMWSSLKERYKEKKSAIDQAMRRGRAEDYKEMLGLVLSSLSTYDMRSFSRWLSLSDSELKKPDESLQISLSSVVSSRGTVGLKILYEVLRPGQTFEVEMDGSNCKLSEVEILSTAHEFYLRVLEKDGAKVDKDPYVLRLGQGSTAFSTSSLILAEELGIREIRVRPPRTRKRIDEYIPMGFVRVFPANERKASRASP